MINYETFKAISEILQITVVRSQTRTTAFNNSEIRMLGFTNLIFSLNIGGDYQIHHKVWITHENTLNILGMKFFHEYCSSLNFEIPLLSLKTFKNSLMYGKHQNALAVQNFTR